MRDAGTAGESRGAALAPFRSCSGKGCRCVVCLAPPPVKGEGDTPHTSLGKGAQRSGLGGALGSCEGRGLEQGLGRALFNGLHGLGLEASSVGSTGSGFLWPARVIYEP